MKEWLEQAKAAAEATLTTMTALFVLGAAVGCIGGGIFFALKVVLRVCELLLGG